VGNFAGGETACGGCGLPISQFIQILLIHAKMMPDFVEHRGSDLLDQVRFAVAGQLDVLLKDVNHIRKLPGVHDASLRPRPAVVEPEQEVIRIEPNASQLLSGRSVTNLDRDFFEELAELWWKLLQGLLHQLGESL
jgi:hypothetical protein